eukprot:TRINITY_DN5960_c0_g1_i1.p1 TRINITY_DN5960_c0_g1~~TRINITY_DN5960_c0_g1_i1.p1  ORF type:complete len:165 (-),score=32.57 TRINITY_DN5960_c0_g1_i1:8-502(-)
MVMAKTGFSVSKSYAFLADVMNQFIQQYDGEWEDASPLEMNNSFSRYMANKKAFYETATSDKIGQVNKQLEDTKQIILSNLEKVLERGASIEILLDKTSEMENLSFTMADRSKKLKNALWWRNAKLTIAIVVIVIIIILILVSIGCSQTGFLDLCFPPNTNTTA